MKNALRIAALVLLATAAQAQNYTTIIDNLPTCVGNKNGRIISVSDAVDEADCSVGGATGLNRVVHGCICDTLNTLGPYWKALGGAVSVDLADYALASDLADYIPFVSTSDQTITLTKADAIFNMTVGNGAGESWNSYADLTSLNSTFYSSVATGQADATHETKARAGSSSADLQQFADVAGNTQTMLIVKDASAVTKGRFRMFETETAIDYAPIITLAAGGASLGHSYMRLQSAGPQFILFADDSGDAGTYQQLASSLAAKMVAMTSAATASGTFSLVADATNGYSYISGSLSGNSSVVRALPTGVVLRTNSVNRVTLDTVSFRSTLPIGAQSSSASLPTCDATLAPDGITVFMWDETTGTGTLCACPEGADWVVVAPVTGTCS